MSVYDRLTPGTTRVAASCRQAKERAPVSALLPLASPVVKKKVIQIPSFDEKGLVHEKYDSKQTADRSFIPVCSSKSCQHSQMNHRGRGSTLPRTKPTATSSPTLSAKPSISVFPAPQPNSSPTPTLTLKPSDSAPAAQLSEPSPPLHLPQPKPSVSPTLIVPTPRLSPSPTGSDSQGGKQPPPVAKERRVRSIAISNAKSLPQDTKRDILDLEVFLDFTHPTLGRSCPATTKESVTSANLGLLQGKSKKENISKDKQTLLRRNFEFTAISKPNTNIKQQLEFPQSGLTSKQKTCLCEGSEGIKSANVVHRDSQSVFDGLASQWSRRLQRKCTDYPQNRHYAQSEAFASRHRSYQHKNSERSAALQLNPKISFSTQPPSSQSTVSPNIETRRRRFDLPSEKKVDAAFPPGSGVGRPQGEQNNLRTSTGRSELPAPRSIQPRQDGTLRLKAHGRSAQTEWAAEDYSCESRCIDQTVEAARCVHRLNPLKTCLVAPQTQEASRAAVAECATSQTGNAAQPDIQSQKHPLYHEMCAGHDHSYKEVKVSDRDLSQRAVFEYNPEYNPEKNRTASLAHGSLSTHTSGIATNGVPLSPLQQRTCQREETMTMASLQPPGSPANRARVMEEPEDPYYVTMHYPGSVYVGVKKMLYVRGEVGRGGGQRGQRRDLRCCCLSAE